MTFTPTREQEIARETFDLGEPMKIFAAAGTGKTAVLKYIADEHPDERGQYVAFNRALVDEARDKFPDNVSCRTAHSLAYGSIGWRYKDRLGAERKRARDLVRSMGVYSFRANGHTLDDWQVVNIVQGTVDRFCQSADEVILPKHVPYVPSIDREGDNHNRDILIDMVLPKAERVWAELQKPDGGIYRFQHGHYLKMFQLSQPHLDVDFVLFDEAQDASPVLASIAMQQGDHAQLCFVGDSAQAIYGFTGAVNALERLNTQHECFLTLSFRFGKDIANYANQFLALLDARLRLVGHPDRDSTIETLSKPDAILTRTNATAVSKLISLREEGEDAHLVGGGDDVIRFCSAAMDLKTGRKTTHPELIGFVDWTDVVEYANDEEDGADLKLLVDLVQRYGALEIKRAIQQMPTERDCDLVISTAHKSKGLQFDTVQLSGDFKLDDDTSDEELKLLYVACTRAKHALDPGPLRWNMRLAA